MSRVAEFVKSWLAEPPPTWELRQASARWSMGHKPQQRHRLRVVETIDETPTTRTFVLAKPDGSLPDIDYRAGQHLTLLLDIDGTPARRCYSFSSAPGTSTLPAITVRRVADGRVSSYLHDQVTTGDTLLALEPSGSFTLDESAGSAPRLALIAGGVGVTPLISIAESALRRLPDSRVVLLCGHRNEGEIIFRRRLDALEREFGERMSLHYSLDDAPGNWTDLQGPLDGRRVLDVVGADAADLYFVCGPEPMMESVCAALADAGVPRERLRTEKFVYADASRFQLPEQPGEFVLARSGRRVRARPGQTLLQAGLEAGLDLPYSCTMGGCGACKLRRSEGKVVMAEPNCLSDTEREAGYLLACCSYGDGRVVIEDI